MSEWSRLLDAITSFAEKRAVPSFIKGVGNAWRIDYANRVSADERDAEKNDFHGLCVSRPSAKDC